MTDLEKLPELDKLMDVKVSEEIKAFYETQKDRLPRNEIRRVQEFST